MSIENEPAIQITNVSKHFRLPHERTASFKNALINLTKQKRGFETQQVLNDITFDIKKGDFFGIVGRNGSGKSTLLKLLAGIYAPNKGHVNVNGSLTPFIELGVGFNPELTGKENIFLNGALLGFSRKEMQAMYNDIVGFAELERFMDQKLKNYSSGMQVRLAFSIAIRAKSDILLIDEVLAVGDAAFQHKCFEHFMILKKNKQTVVLVTHDMGAVRQYCDKAVMIDKGVIVKSGKPEIVAQAYQELFNKEIAELEHKENANKKAERAEQKRWGTGGLREQSTTVEIEKEAITITSRFVADADIPAPIFGFTIHNASSTNVVEGNTLRYKHKTKDMQKGDTAEIVWQLPNIFASGVYDVSVACCDQSTTKFYDWLNEAASFKIRKEGFTAGVIDPNLRITKFAVLKDSKKGNHE